MLETLLLVMLWAVGIIAAVALSPFLLILAVILLMVAFMGIMAVLFIAFFVVAIVVKIIMLPFEKLADYVRERRRSKIETIKRMNRINR
jgi:hypothetical protein